MVWELNIKKIDNGYLLTTAGEDTHEYVFQERDEDEDNDLETVREMLYQVLEHFAIFYSKHNKKNIKIEIEETNG